MYLEELAAACSGSGTGGGGTTTGLGGGLDGSRGSITAGAMTLQPLGSLVSPEHHHHHHTGHHHHHGTTTPAAGDHRGLGRMGSSHGGSSAGLHGGTGQHTSPPPPTSAPAPIHLRPHHTTTAHSPVKLEAQHTRIGEYRFTLLKETLGWNVGPVNLRLLNISLTHAPTLLYPELFNFLFSFNS